MGIRLQDLRTMQLDPRIGISLEELRRERGWDTNAPTPGARPSLAPPSEDELGPPEKIAAPEAPPEPEDEAGAIKTGARMVGQAVENVAQRIGGGVSLSADLAETGLKAVGVSPQTAEQFAGGTRLVSDWLRNLDIVEDPDVGLDYLMRSEGVADAVRRGGVAAVGTLIMSLPDMIAATGKSLQFGTYLTTVLGDSAKAHAVNRTKDPKAEPTAEDYGWGALALPSAMLDRISAGVLFKNLAPGASKKIAEMIGKAGESVVGKAVKGTGRLASGARAAGTGSIVEGLTEMPQSALEYLAATADTDAFDPEEMKRQVIEGGTLGALSGGLAGGVHGAVAPEGARKSRTGLLENMEEVDQGALAPVSKNVSPDIEAALGAVDKSHYQPQQREMFQPTGPDGMGPVIRALGPSPGPEPAAPETGTTTDPRQLSMLDAVEPAQTSLPIGPNEAGANVPASRRLLPTTLLPEGSSLRNGVPTTPPVAPSTGQSVRLFQLGDGTWAVGVTQPGQSGETVMRQPDRARAEALAAHMRANPQMGLDPAGNLVPVSSLSTGTARTVDPDINAAPKPVDGRQGSLLDPSVAAAIDATRGTQVEAFTPDEMTGPQPYSPALAAQGRPQPGPGPLGETGTIQDPNQRDLFSRGTLSAEARRRIMASRAQELQAQAQASAGAGPVDLAPPAPEQLGPPEKLTPAASSSPAVAAGGPVAAPVAPATVEPVPTSLDATTPAPALAPASPAVGAGAAPVAPEPQPPAALRSTNTRLRGGRLTQTPTQAPAAVAGRDYSAFQAAPAPEAAPEAEPAPTQPVGPQVAIGPTPSRPSFLPTPRRMEQVNRLRQLMEESNQLGAAGIVGELATRARNILTQAQAAGVPTLSALEQAAGLRPGAVQSQLDALQHLARDTGPAEGNRSRANAVTEPTTRGRRRKGVASVEQLKRQAASGKVARTSLTVTKDWSPDPAEVGVLDGKAVYAPNHVQADLSRMSQTIGGTMSRFRALAAKLQSLGLSTAVEIAEPGSLGDRAAEYDVDSDTIRMSPDLDGMQWDLAMLHEAVHAATARALRADPKLAAQLDAYREGLKGQLEAVDIDRLRDALDSNDELLALGLTDPDVQGILERYPAGKDTLLGKLTDWAAKAVGLTGKPRGALKELIALSDKVIDQQARDGADKLAMALPEGQTMARGFLVQEARDALAGFTVNAWADKQGKGQLGVVVRFEPSPDESDHMALKVRLGENVPTVTPEQLRALAKRWGAPAEHAMAFVRDAVFANFDAVKMADGTVIVAPHNVRMLWRKGETLGLTRERLLSTTAADRLLSGGTASFLSELWSDKGDHATQAGHFGRRLLTKVQPVNQLVQWYRDVFQGTDRNPLLEWNKALDQRRAHEGRLREVAQDVVMRHNDLSEDDATTLGEIAIFSTMMGVDPNSVDPPVKIDADDRERVKIEKQKVIRAHERARKVWATLSPEVQKVFNDTRDFYKDRFRERRSLILQQALVARGVPEAAVAGITGTTSLGDVLTLMDSHRLHPGRTLTPAERRVRQLVRQLYQEKPVYFPLRRHGHYFTSVESPETVTYADFADFMADADRRDDPTLVRMVRKRNADKTDKSITVDYVYRDVAFHNSIAQGRHYLEQLARENPELMAKSVITKPSLRKEVQGGREIPVQELILKLSTNLEGHSVQAKRDAIDTVLQLMPELSTWKARMQRKNVPGVKPEEFRVSNAREMKALARQEAVLRYARTLARSLADANNMIRETRKAGEADRASKMEIAISQIERLSRLDARQPPGPLQEMGQRLVGMAGFTGFLASPSFAAINMTQTFVNTLPVLGGRHGFGKAALTMREVSKSMRRYPLLGRAVWSSKLGTKAILKMATGMGSPDPKLRDLTQTIRDNLQASSIRYKDDILRADDGVYDQLVERGRASESQTTELLNTARQGSGMWRRLDDAMEIAREMSNAAETSNRVVTGIASYILERERGKSHEDAVQAAVDDIDLTQFVYDTDYRSEAFRRLPRFTTQFKDYAVGTYNLLATYGVQLVFAKHKGDRVQAAKTLGALLLSYSAMGGIVGTTFAEPWKLMVHALVEAYRWATGDDGPEDNQDWLRKNARDIASDFLGTPWAGEALVGGLPRLIGADISTRVSLGQLLFSDPRATDPEGWWATLLAQGIAGPTLYQTGASAVKMFDDPSMTNMLGMLPIIPKQVGDIWKAYQLANTGLTDQQGDVVLGDPGNMAVLWQAMGFTPGPVARTREKRAVWARAEQEEAGRRNDLLERFRNSDPSERDAIIEDVKHFNANKPMKPITNRSLVNSLKAKRQRERDMALHGGVDIGRKEVPALFKVVGVMPD